MKVMVVDVLVNMTANIRHFFESCKGKCKKMQNVRRFYAFLVGRSQKWNPMSFGTMDIDQVRQINNNLNNMIQQLFREQQHSSRLGRWPNNMRDNGQRKAGKERQGTNKQQHWQHKPTTESDTKEDSDVIVMCYRCCIVVPKFAGNLWDD